MKKLFKRFFKRKELKRVLIPLHKDTREGTMVFYKGELYLVASGRYRLISRNQYPLVNKWCVRL